MAEPDIPKRRTRHVKRFDPVTGKRILKGSPAPPQAAAGGEPLPAVAHLAEALAFAGVKVRKPGRGRPPKNDPSAVARRARRNRRRASTTGR